MGSPVYVSKNTERAARTLGLWRTGPRQRNRLRAAMFEALHQMAIADEKSDDGKAMGYANEIVELSKTLRAHVVENGV